MEELNEEEMLGTEGGACKYATGHNIEVQSKSDNVLYVTVGPDVLIDRIEAREIRDDFGRRVNAGLRVGQYLHKNVKNIIAPSGLMTENNHDFLEILLRGRLLRIRRQDAFGRGAHVLAKELKIVYYLKKGPSTAYSTWVKW